MQGPGFNPHPHQQNKPEEKLWSSVVVQACLWEPQAEQGAQSSTCETLSKSVAMT